MINQEQQRIIEEFSLFDDWMDRYTYLIACGAELAPMEEKYRTEETRFRGCASNVWLKLWQKDGRVMMCCDSDSLIVKGLLALYHRLFHGRTPQDILQAELFFEKETGIAEHMPADRVNGMARLVQAIRQFAVHMQGVSRND